MLPIVLIVSLLQSGVAAAQAPTSVEFGPLGSERFRLKLEQANQSLEKVRVDLEEQRQNEEIGSHSYVHVLDKYRQGIKDYREGMQQYRLMVLDQAASPVASEEAATKLAVTRLTLADAQIAQLEATATDANALRTRSKQALMTALDGADFDAARSYVQDRFPRQANGVDAPEKADAVRVFVQKVRVAVTAMAMDLTVSSVPSAARVVIRPKYGSTPRTGSTNMLFQNLRKGLYVVTVSLGGYRTYTDDLDLLDDGQSRLVCTMHPAAGGAASSCARQP